MCGKALLCFALPAAYFASLPTPIASCTLCGVSHMTPLVQAVCSPFPIYNTHSAVVFEGSCFVQRLCTCSVLLWVIIAEHETYSGTYLYVGFFT